MKLKEILNSPQSKVCGLLAQYYKENPITAEKEASDIDPTVAANIAHLLSTEITSQLQQNISSHETKSGNLVLILKVISRLALFDIPIQQLIQADITNQLGKVLSFCLTQSMLLNSFRPTTVQDNLWNSPISALLHALDLIAYNDNVEKKGFVEIFNENLLKLISGQEYSYLVKRRSVQILNTVANDKAAKNMLFKSDSVSNHLIEFAKLVSVGSDFLLQSNLIEFLYRGFCINQKIVTESILSALFGSVASYKTLVNDFKKISKSEPEKDIRSILTKLNNELKEKPVYCCKCAFVEFGTRKLNTEWVDFAFDHLSITYEDEEEIDTFDIPFSEICLMRVSQKNKLMLQLNAFHEEFKDFYKHENEDHFITVELTEEHDIQLIKTKISQLIQKELSRVAALHSKNPNSTPKVSTCAVAIPAFRVATSFSQEIVHLETEELEDFVPKEIVKSVSKVVEPIQDSDTENGQHIGSSLVESIQKKNHEIESHYDAFVGPTVSREQIPSIMKADVSFLLDEIENMDEEQIKPIESSKKRGQKRKLTESEKPKKDKQKSSEIETKEKKSTNRRSSRNSTKKNYKQDSDDEQDELEIPEEEIEKVEKPAKKSKTKKNTEPQLPSTGKKSSKVPTPPTAPPAPKSVSKKESNSTTRQKEKEQFGGSDGLVDFDALMKKPITVAEAAAVLEISDDESVKSRATIATEALFPSHKKKYTIHESSDEEEEFVRPKQRQKQDRKSTDNRRDLTREAKPSRNSDILPLLNYDSEQSSQDFEESSRLFMEQFNKLLLMGKNKKQKKIQEKHRKTEDKINSMIQNHIIEMERSLESIKEWFSPKKKSNEEVLSTAQKKIKTLYLKFQKDLQEQLTMAKKVDTDNRELESQLKDKLLAHKTAEKIATSDLEKKIYKEINDCESTIKQIKQKDTQSQFVAMMQNLLKTKQNLSQEDSSADEGTVMTSDY